MTAAATTARSLGVATWALLACLMVFMGLDSVLGIVGPPVIVALGLIVLLYHLESRRILVNLPLMGFTAVGIVYLWLSAENLLPVPEFGRRFPDYVLRTGYFAALFFPLVSGLYFFWKRILLADREGTVFLICAISFLVIFPVAQFLIGYEVPEVARAYFLGGEANLVFTNYLRAYWFYGPINHTIPLLMALSWMVQRPGKSGRDVVVTIAFFLLAVVSLGSVQMGLVLALLLVFRVVPVPAALARVGTAFLVIVPPVFGYALVGSGVTSVRQIAGFHSADAIARALWWHDFLLGFLRTALIGGGFGADPVRYDFRAFLAEHNTDTLPVIVPHNDFVYIAYSMGVLGLGFFVFYYWDMARRLSWVKERWLRAHLGFLVVAMVFAHAVNSCISSPRYIVGLAFCGSYVLAHANLARRIQGDEVELALPARDAELAGARA